MRRRTLFKMLSSVFILPLIRVPKVAAQQGGGASLQYKDSDGNTITTELSDRNLTTGINYGA